MASSGTGAGGSMRPRANTISHVDDSALGLLTSGSTYPSRGEAVENALNQSNLNGLPGVAGYHFRGMSSASGHHGNLHGLPKLETKNQTVDVGASLRTAPVYGHFGSGADSLNHLQQPRSTINPAQLHFATSPHHFNFDSPQSPFGQAFPGFLPSQGNLEHDGSFPWLSSFENQMSFHEHAIDNSSPSESEGSPDMMSEMMLDSSMNPSNTADIWQTPISQAPFNPTFSLDPSGPQFSDLYGMGQLSPKSMTAQLGADQFYPTPPPLSSQPLPSAFPGMGNQYFQSHIGPKSETPSNSAASISSSNRLSSETSVSTDSITDATRSALLTSLSQHFKHGFNNFKTSQPQVSSPLSPGASLRSSVSNGVPLPSTHDLQRYVGAYIQYFHPHMPFLHIATLSFDTPAYTGILRSSSGHTEYSQSGIAGGGGALILAMAAIGALYEYDFGPSKDLFDMSRTMIRLYTGVRRKVDVSTAQNGSLNPIEGSEGATPLWLVQAMLLNVIYGHNCGDKVAAGIASTLCGTVINLARSARLVNPPSDSDASSTHRAEDSDVSMNGIEGELRSWNDFSPFGTGDLQGEWLRWKQTEERKRTLFAVFILSSLLVSAYNHPPALMNSEIRLNLPCDENLWAAESAEAWKSQGGSVNDSEAPFVKALTSLLTAHQREQQVKNEMSNPLSNSSFGLKNLPLVDFKPSTFGCLVLINALHNYIWETRQRHTSLEWTTQETEAMHARIQPALKTWQAAWSLNPEHSMERPNPFGVTSMSADCIPLLDLAYLRLFVNLGRSKEAFFNRDWDAMANELAHGKEIVQHADHSMGINQNGGPLTDTSNASPNSTEEKDENPLAQLSTPLKLDDSFNHSSALCSKRERHLRKAAFYAANSLTLSDHLGVTFADFNSRELPLQSALCAFDCAQVLAEWISTLQQRVGPHLGILGKDPIDLSEGPIMVFLEKEDRELIKKIDEILSSTVLKLDNGGLEEVHAVGPTMEESGYGGKILLVHARMFERASIWPSKWIENLKPGTKYADHP